LSSRDGAVGIATAYGLDDRGVAVRVPVGSEFSLLHTVQTGSGAHPTSYPMGTRGSLAGGKWIGHVLRRNCLLKEVIEGKIEGRIEVTRRRK
ncbi:hypothetical protein B7P43_G08264, partial [Cryptotermes secundus]